VTSMNSRSVHSVADASRVLGGGDFAGLTANFAWPSGDLIEIQQHLVPKALVEWGQVPTCLEVLTSESPDECIDSETDHTGRPSRKMARYTTTVLPSVGCAVDNLETTASGIDRFETCSILTAHSPASKDEAWPVRVISYWPTNHMSRRRIVVEATFPIGHHPGSAWGTRDGFDFQREGHRIRISVPLELTDRDGTPSVHPVSPLSITCERMVSQVSSRGTLADGGGLDGQSVSRMLGPFLQESYDSFAQKRMNPSSSSLVAASHDRLQASMRDRIGSNEACESFLKLPFNMTLSSWVSNHSVAELSICIGHIDVSPKTGDVTDTATPFVHNVFLQLQVRVPDLSLSRPEEPIILNPSTFVFTTHVDRLRR
jgi:hypothetical protein